MKDSMTWTAAPRFRRDLTTRYLAYRRLGLLPVTATALIVARVALYTMLAGAVLVLGGILIVQFHVPSGVSIVVIGVILYVPAFASVTLMTLVSDLAQIAGRLRGQREFVSAYSRGSRFWRLIFARLPLQSV